MITLSIPSIDICENRENLVKGERIAKLRNAEGEAQRIRLIGEADASAIEAVSITGIYNDIGLFFI